MPTTVGEIRREVGVTCWPHSWYHPDDKVVFSRDIQAHLIAMTIFSLSPIIPALKALIDNPDPIYGSLAICFGIPIIMSPLTGVILPASSELAAMKFKIKAAFGAVLVVATIVNVLVLTLLKEKWNTVFPAAFGASMMGLFIASHLKLLICQPFCMMQGAQAEQGLHSLS